MQLDQKEITSRRKQRVGWWCCGFRWRHKLLEEMGYAFLWSHRLVGCHFEISIMFISNTLYPRLQDLTAWQISHLKFGARLRAWQCTLIMIITSFMFRVNYILFIDSKRKLFQKKIKDRSHVVVLVESGCRILKSVVQWHHQDPALFYLLCYLQYVN